MGTVVQRLSRFQTGEMLAHLRDLSAEDLRLRFGASIGPEALEQYVQGIDFSRDRVFATFDADLALAGLAHLAVDAGSASAELGLSVGRDSRRGGHGQALLRRAAAHASSLGLRTIYMHCLSENSALMGLARKAGFRIASSRGESDACLRLEDSRAAGIAMELVNERVALVDGLRRQHTGLLRALGRRLAITGG